MVLVIFTTIDYILEILWEVFQEIQFLPFWGELVLQISTHCTMYTGIAIFNFGFSLMPLDISLSKLMNSKLPFKLKHLKIILVLELRHETFEKRDRLFCLASSNNGMFSGISTAAKQKQTLNKIMYVTTACYSRKLPSWLFLWSLQYLLFLIAYFWQLAKETVCHMLN